MWCGVKITRFLRFQLYTGSQTTEYQRGTPHLSLLPSSPFVPVRKAGCTFPVGLMSMENLVVYEMSSWSYVNLYTIKKYTCRVPEKSQSDPYEIVLFKVYAWFAILLTTRAVPRFCTLRSIPGEGDWDIFHSSPYNLGLIFLVFGWFLRRRDFK